MLEALIAFDEVRRYRDRLSDLNGTPPFARNPSATRPKRFGGFAWTLKARRER
jgi:hypothetical protein